MWFMFIIIILLFVLIIALVFLFASAIWAHMVTKVPFVPSSSEDAAKVFGELNLSKKDIFYELGSGDGRICFTAERLIGCKVVGFELGWAFWAIAQLRKYFSRSAVIFHRSNFFNYSWSEATVIYCYLLTD